MIEHVWLDTNIITNKNLRALVNQSGMGRIVRHDGDWERAITDAEAEFIRLLLKEVNDVVLNCLDSEFVGDDIDKHFGVV